MTIRRLLTLTLLAFMAAFAMHLTLRRAERRTVAQRLPKPASTGHMTRSLRPRYPYSIIPGGVFSAAELAKAAEQDASVREHYKDFDVQRAHVVATSEDRLAYVSYRAKGKIFWTQKRLRIPKGETLITDGTNFGRTRCGNRLSDTPHAEVMATEPSEEVLNFAPGGDQRGTASSTSSTLGGVQELPGTPMPVPEPATGWLVLLTGSIGVWKQVRVRQRSGGHIQSER